MRWTIGTKLAFGFGTVIGLMMISAAIVLLSAARIKQRVEDMMNHSYPTARSCETILGQIYGAVAAQRGGVLLGDDPAKLRAFTSDRTAAWVAIDEAQAQLSGASRDWTDTADKQRLAEIKTLLHQLREDYEKVEAVAHGDHNNRSLQLLEREAAPEADSLLTTITSIIDEQALRPASADSQRLLRDLAAVRVAFEMELDGLRSFVMTGNGESQQRLQRDRRVRKQAIDSIGPRAADLPPQLAQAWQDYQRRVGAYELLSDRIVALRAASDWNQALYLMDTVTVPLTRAVEDLVHQLRASSEQSMHEQSRELMAASDRLAVSLAMATLVAVLIAAVVGGLLSRRIAASVRILSERAGAIASGNLTGAALAIRSNDEVGELSLNFDKMQAGLRELAGQVRIVTESVNVSASQIASSSQQQSSSTREQAATVQQITTTMQEISQVGAQVVSQARELSATADASATVGAAGMEAVKQVRQTMEAIRDQVEDIAENIVALSEKTQAIGDIVATVNEVAEQSNLLALNATIEAVGAGEQGNRFSVVANEMKSLADQAKRSTIQVRDLLGDIQKGINKSVMLTEEAVKRVESGREKATATEETIRQLSETTENNVQAYQQILGATNQQQIGLEQVTQGMEDIRTAAQQTATGTSQLNQAVSNLTALSRQLKSAVGSYQI